MVRSGALTPVLPCEMRLTARRQTGREIGELNQNFHREIRPTFAAAMCFLSLSLTHSNSLSLYLYCTLSPSLWRVCPILQVQFLNPVVGPRAHIVFLPMGFAIAEIALWSEWGERGGVSERCSKAHSTSLPFSAACACGDLNVIPFDGRLSKII